MQYLRKRDFLAGAGASLGLGLAGSALAQTAAAPAASRGGRPAPAVTVKGKTTVLFKSPEGFPNGMALDERGRGFWIAENLSDYPNWTNCNMYLVDFKGKVLQKIQTPATNTSGIGQGNGHLYVGGGDGGVLKFNIDTGKLVATLPFPLVMGPPTGGTHGMAWDPARKKMWASLDRLDIISALDPDSFAPGESFEQDVSHFQRHHGICMEGSDYMWDCAWRNDPAKGGAASTGPNDGNAGMMKYDLKTGRSVQYVDFLPGSCDPHANAFANGVLYGCDCGIHPNWPRFASPTTGAIFRVDII